MSLTTPLAVWKNFNELSIRHGHTDTVFFRFEKDDGEVVALALEVSANEQGVFIKKYAQNETARAWLESTKWLEVQNPVFKQLTVKDLVESAEKHEILQAAELSKELEDGFARLHKFVADERAAQEARPKRVIQRFLWKLVHNVIAHPLLMLPLPFGWAHRFHDWTANKM